MSWGKYKMVENFFCSNKKICYKYCNESVINISEESKFIDSARFMASPLAKLFDNLTEGIQKLNEKIIISFFNMKVLRII